MTTHPTIFMPVGPPPQYAANDPRFLVWHRAFYDFVSRVFLQRYTQPHDGIKIDSAGRHYGDTTFFATVAAMVAGDTATLVAAKAYADALIAAGLAYVDTQDAATLAAAKAYTNAGRDLFYSAGASAAIKNTTTETAFAQTFTMAAGSLAVGQIIRVKMWGVYGTTIVAPTIRIKLKIAGITLLDSQPVTCIAAITNGGWSAEAYLYVASIGAGGTVESQAYGEFSTAATTSLSVNVANTAVGALDTTASMPLTVTAQWGAADNANTIQCRLFTGEVMKVAA